MIKVGDVYPITKTTFPCSNATEGHQSMGYILNMHIKEYTKEEDLHSLLDFLFGSTRYIEGVYATDVEQWLNRRKEE